MNATTATPQQDPIRHRMPARDLRAVSPPATATPADAPDPLPPHTAVIDGRLLRELRRQAGLSQENLAYRAGIGLTTIARLERQPRPRCRINTLALLAAALDQSPYALALLVRASKNHAAQPITAVPRARMLPVREARDCCERTQDGAAIF